MSAIEGYQRGRDFTPEELVGQRIRIEGPVKKLNGYEIMIIAGDEMVGNATRLELDITPDHVVSATITLLAGPDEHGNPTFQRVTTQDDITLSFSAIVSEVK